MKLYAITKLNRYTGKKVYLKSLEKYTWVEKYWNETYSKWVAEFGENLYICCCYLELNEAMKDLEILQTVEEERVTIIEIDSKDLLLKPIKDIGEL
jgi:hypothetical protein